jgi:hypothetical protein
VPQETTSDEHRIAGRHRVLKQGKILIHNLSVVDCIVRDMSETGARLACADPKAIPAEFRLVTPVDNMMREARVKWRRGEVLGIAFVGEPRRAPPRKW